MYADITSILEKVKGLIGIEDTQHDTKLTITIEMMMDEVKNFCNISPLKSVPKQLENTIVQMILDYLKINPMGIEKFEGGNVKSISRGDTTINYNTSETTVNIHEFMKGYQERLMPFRKFKMR